MIAPFDAVMAYMDMVENGISPEDELEEKRQGLLTALQDIGADLEAILKKRQEEIDATSRAIIQKLAEEQHFSAAEKQLSVLEDACQESETGIKMLQGTNTGAQKYLQQLQRENAQLHQQLIAAKQKSKERPPLGPNQGEILRGAEAFTRHISK